MTTHVPDGAAVPSPDEERRAVGVSGEGARADGGGGSSASRGSGGSAGPRDGEILTERLRLTPVAEADEAELFALHSDPRAFVEDSTDPLTDPAQMRWVLAQWRRSRARHGLGHLAVRAREGADLPVGLLGVVGLVPLVGDGSTHRTVLSAYWRLHPEVTGRGVATEAMRAVLDALEDGAACEIVAITDRGNTTSLALASRLGFVPAPPDRPVPGGRADDVLLLLDPSAARASTRHPASLD